MTVRVQAEDFDVGAEIAALTGGRTDMGAVVSFTGLVRDLTPEGGTLSAMTIEHYPAMTKKALAEIEAEARARWPLGEVLVIHRHGTLEPGDRIVLVAVASAHRAAAFEAAWFLMDYLKTRAPFWKRETGAAGEAWVEAAAEDDAALDKWRR